jgi:hypothetical protein
VLVRTAKREFGLMARVIIIRLALGQQVVLYNRTCTICRTLLYRQCESSVIMSGVNIRGLLPILRVVI